MSTSSEPQSRGAQFMVFPMRSSMPLKEFQKQNSLPKNKTQKKSPKHLWPLFNNFLRNTSHLTFTPRLPTNVKVLKPKASQATDLNIKHRPEFFGERFLFKPPKKGIAFKSPPCSEGELLVQVICEVSGFYPRITNIIWEIIPIFSIMPIPTCPFSLDHNLNHCRCLPTVYLKATNL